MSESFLRLPTVMDRTGLSRSSIYARISSTPPDFPQPINLGPRAIGFLESEVEEWIQNRIAESRGGLAGSSLPIRSK
jgi:prophage regulatory protein